MRRRSARLAKQRDAGSERPDRQRLEKPDREEQQEAEEAELMSPDGTTMEPEPKHAGVTWAEAADIWAPELTEQPAAPLDQQPERERNLSPENLEATPPSTTVPRRVPVAALIPLRVRHSKLEVLVGQIEVLDGVATSPGSHKVNPFAGEYRVPSRQYRESQITPLEAALEELAELGVLVPSEGIQAMLFAKELLRTEARNYRMLFFVACEDDNSEAFKIWKDDAIEKINSHLDELRRQRQEMMSDNTYWELSRSEKERLSPKLHRLQWMESGELLRQSHPSRSFVNEYQREQFSKYNVEAREPGRELLALLTRMSNLGTLDEIREHAIENSVHAIAGPKRISKDMWRAQLEEDADITKGINEISLLSYNLNCLPRGVGIFSMLTLGTLTDQGLASEERIDQFVRRIKKKNFDIIALQEVFATPALPPFCRQQYLIRKMRDAGYSNVVQSRPLSLYRRIANCKWTDSGLLILSRSHLAIESSDDISFPNKAIGLDAGATKGVIYARIRTCGKRAMHVFNCHLQATHTGGDGGYSSVRSQQLKALRDFITKKTFGTRDPWVLTGDFNIDAIATSDDHTGEFGFSFQAPRSQSEEYDWLMKAISPRGDVINLLHETEGRHVCTRPPRLSFPKSAAYAFKHKYPQCLDYIFFCNGSVGSIQRTKGSTKIEKFPAEYKSQRTGRQNLIGSACIALGGISSVAVLRLSTQDRAWSTQACMLLSAANAIAFVAYQLSNSQAGMSYDYLSDHFGVSSSFSTELTYTWWNETNDLRPMRGGKPVHQQRADLIESIRPYVGLVTFFGVSAVAPKISWDDECSATFMHSWTMLVSFLAMYGIDRVLMRLVYWIKRDTGDSALLNFVFRVCDVCCQEPAVRQSTIDRRASTIREPPKTVYECLLQGAELYGNLPCLAVREKRADGDLGEYTWISYDETSRRARNFGSGLKRLSEELGGQLRSASGTSVMPDSGAPPTGLSRGAHIGIASENCREWLLVDHACASYSLVSVPLEAHGREFFSRLMQLSDARVIVASKSWMPEVIARYSEGLCPSLQFVVQIERLECDERRRAQDVGLPIYSFEFVERTGQLYSRPVEPPGPDEAYTFAYRWHSHTGEPIGWVVTHRNLVTNATKFGDMYNLSREDTHFSFVPMSYIGERVVITASVQNGAKIGIYGSSGSSKVYSDLKKLKPTFLLSTPHLFSAPLLRYWQALEQTPLRSRATKWALEIKKKRRADQGRCSRIIVRLIDYLVFCKFAEQLGGNVKRIFMLSDATLNYMDTRSAEQAQDILDCPVIKCLALPEAGGLLAVNEPTATGCMLRESLQAQLNLLPEGEEEEKPFKLLGKCNRHGPLGELLLKGPELSKLGEKFAQQMSPGFAQTKTLPRPNDSVWVGRTGWVHTGLLCEVVTGEEVSPDTWNIHFPQLAIHGPQKQVFPSEISLQQKPTTLRVVGRVSSIVEVGGTLVLAEQVEQFYRSRVPCVRQIWCHTRRAQAGAATTDGKGIPSTTGMCAVVCVDHEQVYKWLSNAGLHLDAMQPKPDEDKTELMSEMEMICKRPELREHLRKEMHNVHREAVLPDEAKIVELHLSAESFSPANNLQTPSFRLCRANLRKWYSMVLDTCTDPHASRRMSTAAASDYHEGNNWQAQVEHANAIAASVDRIHTGRRSGHANAIATGVDHILDDGAQASKESGYVGEEEDIQKC